jgi:hypothetical protein
MALLSGGLRTLVSRALASAVCLVGVSAAAASAQERRGLVFGEIGVASIGHSDSKQGTAPIIGGGAAFDVLPRLVVEVDVHGARVRNVFGRDHHDFTETTITGSILFRTPAAGRAHLIVGGGIGMQRAHSNFDVPPVGAINDIKWIRMTHGRGGVAWDVSPRIVIRTDTVLWWGDGLDWVLGGRVGVGYLF